MLSYEDVAGAAGRPLRAFRVPDAGPPAQPPRRPAGGVGGAMRQTVTPYLLYEDAGAALEWLSKAFEFTETERIENPDGTVGHAEMDVGDGSTIFLGSPGEGYQNPRSAGRTALVYVYAEDLD